jgi:hypothetical protein
MNSEFCVHEGRSAYVRSSRTAWHKKNIFTGGERRFQNSRTMRVCHFSFFPSSLDARRSSYVHHLRMVLIRTLRITRRSHPRNSGSLNAGGVHPLSTESLEEPTTITIHRQTTSKSLVLYIVVNGSFSDTGTIVTYQLLNI